MRNYLILISLCLIALWRPAPIQAFDAHILQPVPLQSVTIDDPFWSPKLKTWDTVTLTDVLDKFEKDGAFRNFDRVAGVLDGRHEGPPWFDGLIYETLRGAADLLASYPDKAMEARLDGYIDRIARAQATDPTGYLMTYTQLDEPGHQWGQNGGFLRLQHDVYNAGALVEAGVHYYRATGKVNLLRVAVKLANHMADLMGPAPKANIVPAHSLPEEALVDLYLLFKENPALAAQLDLPVDARSYLTLAEFWLEARGHHAGQPTTEQWDKDEPASQKWVREMKYGGNRPSWGAYAQDDIPIFEQSTIEGHAVRATLLCAGLSAAARVNNNPAYAATADRLWTNMVAKRMHITGGVGAFAHEEKFGPDYDLPNDAYLETCAAVGAGFFHRNMNLLFGDAKYIDELERTLYNNVINGVSLSGTRYYYQNPLSAQDNHRWDWHGCPCCPPMFLKMISALPGYIYATDSDGIYVNLFIGSRANVTLNNQTVQVTQQTEYPWQGKTSITLEPGQETEFTLFVRIPGWADRHENPFGLYRSDLEPDIALTVNGKRLTMPDKVRGYAPIKRKWQKGDVVTLELPMQPRRVYANPLVKADQGRFALQSGPLVYCFEEIDNPAMGSCFLEPDAPLDMEYDGDSLGGINRITAVAQCLQSDGQTQPIALTAIPFYCQDNRNNKGKLEVWFPEKKELVKPLPLPTIANLAKVSVSHCFANDTSAALNDGIEPANSNDHAIRRHTWWDHLGTTEWVQYDFAQPQTISSVSVYWWDDRPAGGRCAIPASWQLLYRNTNGQWQPVPGASPYPTQKDQFNEVTFQPIQTDGLRLEAKLSQDCSAGILEWKVQ